MKDLRIVLLGKSDDIRLRQDAAAKLDRFAGGEILEIPESHGDGLEGVTRRRKPPAAACNAIGTLRRGPILARDSGRAPLAELVDARDSKSRDRKIMSVRFRRGAPPPSFRDDATNVRGKGALPFIAPCDKNREETICGPALALCLLLCASRSRSSRRGPQMMRSRISIKAARSRSISVRRPA